MDFSSFEAFVDSSLLFLNDWGFIIVIVFGVMHPLIENPLHLFNMSLAIAILGIPVGYMVVFLSNVVGILVLFYLTRMANEKSNNFLQRRKVSKKV